MCAKSTSRDTNRHDIYTGDVDSPSGYLNTSIGFWMRRVSSLMHTEFERRLSRYGITPPQWGVLSVVDSGEAKTPAALARVMQIDSTAVTRLIDRLEKKGLLKRAPNPPDRRSVAVELTESARELLPALEECSKQTNRAFLKGISSDEQRVLMGLLRRLAANATTQHKSEQEERYEYAKR